MEKSLVTVEPIGLEVRDLPRPVTSERLFGNDRPLELEIGVGKGTLLVDQCKQRPGINFIGVELARKYWRLASDRLRRNGLGNGRVVLVEASFFLESFIGSDSLAAIYVPFPDPWPKRRHQKRRLMQEPFLRQVSRCLRPGGRLQMVTDDAPCYQEARRALGSSPLVLVDYLAPLSAQPGELVGTNFERKYRREGRHFYCLAAVKPGTASRPRFPRAPRPT